MAYPKDRTKETPEEFPPFAFRPPGVTAVQTRAKMLTDAEAVALIAEPTAREILGDHVLADAVLEAGLDWEHMIATVPLDLASADPADLAEIERLGNETIRLARIIHAKHAVKVRKDFEEVRARQRGF